MNQPVSCQDHLLQGVADAPVAARRNLEREYVQVYLLRLLHEAGAFRPLAFVGGTALRLLHRLPRFSEGHDPAEAPRWREAGGERLRRLDWATVERDVAPFAERREDLRHLSPKAIAKLL